MFSKSIFISQMTEFNIFTLVVWHFVYLNDKKL